MFPAKHANLREKEIFPAIFPARSAPKIAGKLFGFIILFLAAFGVFSGLFLNVVLGAECDESELFRQTCAGLAQKAEQTGSMAVNGKDNWLFLSSELRHLGAGCFWGEQAVRVSRATKAENADPLPAILDFNDQLKKMNVELLVVPVPPKAVIYAEGLPAFTNKNPTARFDRFHREFYALLLSKGVRVLDLTDSFLRNKNEPRGSLYCRHDSHWSGNGCVFAAQKIAAEIRPLVGDGRANIFKADWRTIEIDGDLRSAPGNENISRERLSVRRISKAGSDEPIEPDSGSKIILLGDSHNLVFHSGDDMLCQGAGLPDQLAYELGQPVELVAVRGSGATPARLNLVRRARQKDGYWAQKKCVIWCFAAREFTESDGWNKVPLPKATPSGP